MKLLSLAFCGSLFAQPLNIKQLIQEIEKVIAEPEFHDAFWGIAIYAPERESWIYQHLAHKNFRPASNMKIVSNFLGFEKLGPNYEFETTIWIDGPIVDGVLYGNLLLEGGYDPGLGSWYQPGSKNDLDGLAHIVQQAGIQHIRGDVLPVIHSWQRDGFLVSWEWDDLGTYYTSPVVSLGFYDGWFDVLAEVGKAGDISLTFTPEIEGIEVQSSLADIEEPNFRYYPLENKLDIELPEAPCQQYLETFSHAQPQDIMCDLFQQTLNNAGIEVLGMTVEGGQKEVIGSFKSLPLWDLAQTMMKVSQNRYADFFYVQAALNHGYTDSEETSEWVQSLLAEEVSLLGIEGKLGSQFLDGSGLSHQNQLKPQELIALLASATDKDYFEKWLATFPVMGLEGTLERRGGYGADGFVWAKTGYINRTRTLSGYVLTHSGEPIIFSLMANQYSCKTSHINRTQDRLCGIVRRLKPAGIPNPKLRQAFQSDKQARN